MIALQNFLSSFKSVLNRGLRGKTYDLVNPHIAIASGTSKLFTVSLYVTSCIQGMISLTWIHQLLGLRRHHNICPRLPPVLWLLSKSLYTLSLSLSLSSSVFIIRLHLPIYYPLLLLSCSLQSKYVLATCSCYLRKTWNILLHFLLLWWIQTLSVTVYIFSVVG